MQKPCVALGTYTAMHQENIIIKVASCSASLKFRGYQTGTCVDLHGESQAQIHEDCVSCRSTSFHRTLTNVHILFARNLVEPPKCVAAFPGITATLRLGGDGNLQICVPTSTCQSAHLLIWCVSRAQTSHRTIQVWIVTTFGLLKQACMRSTHPE